MKSINQSWYSYIDHEYVLGLEHNATDSEGQAIIYVYAMQVNR
jgi:hypothetical protein